MFFTVVGILGIVLMFIGLVSLLSLSGRGLTNEARGKIRRWTRQAVKQKVPNVDSQLLKETEEDVLNFCQNVWNTHQIVLHIICIALTITGGLIGTFAIFFGNQIGNPPVWEAAYDTPIATLAKDTYIIPTANGDYEFFSSKDNECQTIPASLFNYSLNNPMGFWSNVTIKHTTAVEPHVVAYVGNNNTSTTFYRYVVYIP